jgi:hypothetical protein
MSGASSQATAVAAHVARAVHGHRVVLNGRTTNLVTVDRQGIAHVTGTGRMSGLGSVTISGTVNAKAENSLLSSPWLLYADLVITSPKGQIDVHVTPGTIGLNPFSQPVHLQYSAHGGTGAFRHATGTGLVNLSLYQAIPTNLTQLKQMGVQIDTVGVRFALDFQRGHLDQWGNFAGMWYGIIESLVKKSDGPPAHHAGQNRGSRVLREAVRSGQEVSHGDDHAVRSRTGLAQTEHDRHANSGG